MEIATKTPGAGVDFHMHTLASDGLWTPEALVETAAAQGIRLMTVSDHDTIGSVAAVQAEAEKRGIGFVPGVEVTINWKNGNYHLLLLNFDPANAALNAMLDDTYYLMQAKQQHMIAELRKRGFKIDKLDDFRRPDGHILSADIARALVRGGEVPTFDRAFQLCREVGIERVVSQPAERAFAVGLEAGAVPVLAHPARQEADISRASLEILKDFVAMGLAGLEAYHYSHKPADIEMLTTFAREHKIAVSCGSDSHNDARKPMPWNPELCKSLLERLDRAAPSLAA